MMKIQTFGAVLALLLFCLSSNAQQLSYYYDASVTQLKGYGYSYNLTINISKSASGYEVKLLKVQPDTKGFLRAGKYYSAAQLGNICPPGDFDRVRIQMRYKYKVGNAGITQNETNNLMFENVGDTKTLSGNASDFSIESGVVIYNDDACIAKIKELENPPKSTTNTPSSNQKSTEVLVNNTPAQKTNKTFSTAQKTANPVTSQPAVDHVAEWNKQMEQDRENLNQSIDNFSNTLNQWAQNVREEKEVERAYAEEMEMLRRQEQAIRQNKIIDRHRAIGKYSPKDVPTGSKEKAERIYYFLYAYNNLNEEYGATAYISNVFEIGKSSDGTRPFTAKIKEEIAGLTPYPEVLHGYYYSREEAEQQLEEFKNALLSSNVIITQVTYKGKPSITGKSADDFWETDKPEAHKEKNKAKTDDFWNE